MKVAIIVFGQIRHLHISVKSWDFMNYWDCDFYISGWEKTTQTGNKSNVFFESEIIDSNYIKQYLKNSTVELFEEDYTSRKYNLCDSNSKKMMFHIKNAYSQIEKSGEKYDFIFLIRSDEFFSFLKDYHDFFKFNKDDTIYALNEIEFFNGKPWVNDLYFWGRFNVMSKFINSIDYNSNVGTHEYFGKLFVDLDIKIKNEHLLDVVLVRPNSLSLENDELNFENILKNTLAW